MDDQLKEDIRFINKYLYAVQKHRIQLSNWIFAKESDGRSPSKRTYKLFKELEDHERRAKRLALEIVSHDPLWTEFFTNIRGVAESLATSLMAEIGEISRFETPSSLWAYGALTAQYVEAKCSNGHKMIMSSDNHETCPILKGFNEQTQEGNEKQINAAVKLPSLKKLQVKRLNERPAITIFSIPNLRPCAGRYPLSLLNRAMTSSASSILAIKMPTL